MSMASVRCCVSIRSVTIACSKFALRKKLPAIARKGSIVIDGTSLTTNSVNGADFTINLIPHTLENTTLHRLPAGRPVNLEWT